jgi:dTDP-glucose pyrophosphorylase
MLRDAVRTADEDKKATVFGYWVNDPERYGVAEFVQKAIDFLLKKSLSVQRVKLMLLSDYILSK